VENINCIEFVKQIGKNHSFDNLEAPYTCQGYFIGVEDLYLVLYHSWNDMTYSIKLRPYHIKFIKETLKPKQWQLITIENLGRDISNFNKTENGFKKHFFNVKINKKFQFLENVHGNRNASGKI
jgi:hypothetical protein